MVSGEFVGHVKPRGGGGNLTPTVMGFLRDFGTTFLSCAWNIHSNGVFTGVYGILQVTFFENILNGAFTGFWLYFFIRGLEYLFQRCFYGVLQMTFFENILNGFSPGFYGVW